MTQQLGVIGDPIKHSLSPHMQQAAIAAAALDATYQAIHVTVNDLANFVVRAKQAGYRGFNITLPHKTAIMEFLDDLSPAAQNIGAVNTVIIESGRALGDNTDGLGYITSLAEDAKWEAKDKTVTLLGAGGAARAVAYALLDSGANQVCLINRTIEKAEQLCANLENLFPKKITYSEWTESTLMERFAISDLIVNSTSVGLNKSRFDLLPLESSPQHCLISDLVYTPRITPLLQSAKDLQRPIHEGLGMLLYQGAAAFELWFHQKPNIKVMKIALEQALEN